MSQESQHVSGGQNSTPQSIYDELDNVYSIAETKNGYQQRAVELSRDPISERQFQIADEIVEARKHYLESPHPTQHEIDKNHFIVGVAKTVFGRVLPLQQMSVTTENELKNLESQKVGALIFGPLNPNEKKRHFWFDGMYNGYAHWFFNQEVETRDMIGNVTNNVVTLHYEVRDNDILRISSRAETPNDLIRGKELSDFVTATELYRTRVMNQIYQNDESDSTLRAA